MGAQQPMRFAKSSFSVNGDCVLWSLDVQRVFVSDSKHPDHLVLETSRADWHGFTVSVGACRPWEGALRAVRDGLAWRVFLAGCPQASLWFTGSEWWAFRRAILAGEVEREAS